MESIFLFIVILIEAGVIVYQNMTIKKISEDALDRVAQKNAGIYYPKDSNKRKEYEEKDKVEVVPIEDVSDEDFLKAVRGKEDNARS